jgi:hypothetical protein
MEYVGMFMAIWYMLWPFGACYDHLVNFIFIRYINSCFGMLYQEKSGNPCSGPLRAKQVKFK